MKNRVQILNGLAAGSLICLLVGGCAKSETGAKPAAASVTVVAPSPSVTVVAAAPVTPSGPVAPAPLPAIKPVVPIPSVAAPQAGEAASWASIENLTFDQRPAFLSGAAALESQLSDQVSELNAKRAAMPSTADTKDWDFAMRDLVVSQAYLRSVIQEAGQATPDIWNDEKEKVGQAWQKAEDSFDKVRTATTL
jgi:hypothetical protein